jgi:selenocysteine-specific elongation factor
MTTDLILGTAGHIDHGKTTLIKCLTGVDTDRLPEEKRRGITIELGFAELDLGDYRLGIVDVPGHERFVRQMLAGATGMDVALLVVAADDSVKPQTREHLDVLRLLDLHAGVIAITKADVADPDWMELVEDEVRELVKGTFFEGAPLVRTSAITGQGMEQLRASLCEAAARAAPLARLRQAAPFRMAIDRSFSVAGHGTVVTGSVSTGSVRLGEALMVEPRGVEVRVRGLHNHDRSVTVVSRGQRAAINLAGVRSELVQRGQELAAPGHLVASRLITVQLQVLPHAPRPLKRRDRVRLHVGTAEVLASVIPLERNAIEPGESALVQLYLSEPVVTTWNQPCVLRSESPVTTVAGGRVLVPAAAKLRRASEATLSRLRHLVDGRQLGPGDSPLRRASAAIYFAATPCSGATDLVRTAGIEQPDDVFRQLLDGREVLALSPSGHRQLYWHQQRLEEAADRIAALLSRWHDTAPLKSGFDRSTLAQEFRYLGDAVVFSSVLDRMERAGRIRLTQRTVGLADRGPQLSKGERQVLEQLLEMFRHAGLQPPSIKECEQAVSKNQKSVRSLIALAVSDGDLIEFGEQLYLHSEVFVQLCAELTRAFQETAALTVSEIRERLGTTRKFAVPLCQYLDRIGFTVRDGDLRRLNAATAEATVG